MSVDIEREVIYRKEVAMTKEFIQAGMPERIQTTMIHSDDGRIVVEEICFYAGTRIANRVSLDDEMIRRIADIATTHTIRKVPSGFALP